MRQSLRPEKLIAEAIGAFTLIFAGAGAIMVTGAQDLVAIALAHGLAIALMVSTLGHISGGLFNPALTIGLWVTRRLDAVNTVGYILAQLVGAVLAALVLIPLFPEVMRQAQNLGTPPLNPGIDFVQGVGIEVVLTFFLMLAVFGTALDPRGPRLGGLVIGLIITMDIFTAGALTGAAMNPARAFGPALVSGTWDNHLVWWIGPIIGAVLAALLYHYVFLYGADEPLEPEEVVSIET
jgi:MIP family channel proteins